MDPELALMARILAWQTEVFAPVRLWNTNQGQNLWQRRRTFAAEGMQWHAGGNEAERKQAQRTLDELVDQGAVIATKKRGRTVGVKLSEQAQLFMRGICAVHAIDVSIRLMQIMRDDIAAGFGLEDPHEDGVLIPESNLTPNPDDPAKCWWYGDTPRTIKPLLTTQQQLNYALCNDWVRCPSDGLGCVYYTFTPLGLQILENPPTDPTDLPPMDEAVEDFFSTTSLEYYRHLQNADVPDPNDLAIPLPHGFHPLEYKKKLRMDES
jgi:hypothetical protein